MYQLLYSNILLKYRYTCRYNFSALTEYWYSYCDMLGILSLMKLSYIVLNIMHQSMPYELLSNLIGSLLLYYDFILHWFTFYGTFNLLIFHWFTFYGGFDWFASSLWSTAVLQVDAAQLTLPAVMLHMMDSLNLSLKSVHKQQPKQCRSFHYCLTWAHLFTSSSFIDFLRISKKCVSWRMLTKFQQGRQSRVDQSFAIE